MKRCICFLLTAVVVCTASFALDFTLTPGGFVSVPLGNGNKDPDNGNTMYGMGGGGELGFEVDLSTIWPNRLGLGYTFGIEGGMIMNQLQSNDSQNVSFYNAGGNLGLYFFPISRLLLRADGGFGVFVSAVDDIKGKPGFFWRAGGKIGFRISPSFIVAANAGWRQYQGGGETRNSGLYAGLTTMIAFQTGKGNEGINAALEQYENLYPAFISLYQYLPVGNVVLRNNENAEIRDVRLSFRAGNYTTTEYLCGTVGIIPRGRSEEIALLASFSPELLRFTSDGRIMGELVIRYKFLGKERESVKAVTLATYDRNTIPPDDATVLASLVSTSSPVVLDLARTVSGMERNNRKTGFNSSFSYTMWLLETMKATGFQFLARGGSSVQFPAETLNFTSGTSRDHALLVASCLESVGFKTALIQVKGNREEGEENETLLAVSLDVTESQAETLFNGTDKILIIDDNVWLPLSLSDIEQGFTACWNKGAAILNEMFKSERSADFIVVQDAWASYPSAPLPELERTELQIDNALVTTAVNSAVQTYIQQEINPIIQRTNSQSQSEAQQNRMGILYVRAGRIAEAKTAYERASGLGSIPAMNNRGNLAFTERDYSTAERWFKQVLQREPDNATALRGIERVEGAR